MGRHVANRNIPLPQVPRKSFMSESGMEECKNNVTVLVERLFHFNPHHEDIIKLESVQTVISVLKNFQALQMNGEQPHVAPSDMLIEKESSACRDSASGQSLSKSGRNKATKFQKCHQTNIRHSDEGNDLSYSKITNPLTKVTLICKSFTQQFLTSGNLYKRLAKNYVFMLKPRKPSKSNFFGVFFSILAFIFYFELHTITGFSRLWLKWENVDLGSVECTIESPAVSMELFRPPVSCAICHNVKSVDRVSQITPVEFERVYAYTGRPVIVTDGMTNWTAPTSFAFEFFKGIYSEGSRSLEHLGEDCSFFPYKTEFDSLAEVFNMSQERSLKSWYIGWSNCDAETSHILREHYHRPYFLPETAESTHADWLFMGTPGHGAHMHIDHVINPSWQGQIKGFKRWHLQPPPECYYECTSLTVDVQPGDIFVLDTNKWYHKTEILAGENSITIGSEYD